MGLTDRDWYRDKPSTEWNRLVRDSDVSPHARRTSGAAYDGPRKPRPFSAKLARLILIGLIGTGALLVGFDKRTALVSAVKHLRHSNGQQAAVNAIGLPGVSNFVVLKMRPGLDTPAHVVTRWWVTDSRFGRVGVYVPVGETPRKALTVAIAQLGYQVINR